MPAFVKKNYTKFHNNGLPPLHPGVMLEEDFLKPLNLTPKDLCTATGIHLSHLKAVLKGRAPITTEDAFRLARYFGMSIDFWLIFQQAYDVKMIETNKTHMAHIRGIKPHPTRAGALIVRVPQK